jgi:hypothetical protein
MNEPIIEVVYAEKSPTWEFHCWYKAADGKVYYDRELTPFVRIPFVGIDSHPHSLQRW